MITKYHRQNLFDNFIDKINEKYLSKLNKKCNDIKYLYNFIHKNHENRELINPRVLHEYNKIIINFKNKNIKINLSNKFPNNLNNIKKYLPNECYSNLYYINNYLKSYSLI